MRKKRDHAVDLADDPPAARQDRRRPGDLFRWGSEYWFISVSQIGLVLLIMSDIEHRLHSAWKRSLFNIVSVAGIIELIWIVLRS